MPLNKLKQILGLAAVPPEAPAAQQADAPEQASAEGAAEPSPPQEEPPRLTPAMRSGMAAEAAAARFLEEKGHRVLERNWRAGRDEIDLITQDGVCLVFVEVRARAASALVGGFHSIDKRKKAALRRVCSAYLNVQKPRPQTYRLDVVQIALGNGGQMTIHHYAGVALFN